MAVSVIGFCLFTGSTGKFTVPIISGVPLPPSVPIVRLKGAATWQVWNYPQAIGNALIPVSETEFEFTAAGDASCKIVGIRKDNGYISLEPKVNNVSAGDTSVYDPDTEESSVFAIFTDGEHYYLIGSEDFSSEDSDINFVIVPDSLSFPIDINITSSYVPPMLLENIDRIEVTPWSYASTFGQSDLRIVTAYSGDSEVADVFFEVGPLPDEARGVRLQYPFNGDNSKIEITMPYMNEGVKPEGVFRVPVKYGEVSTDFRVVFYENNAPYAPGGNVGGGSGVPSSPSGGIGTFPSGPGPSMVESIPTGQTGNDLANSGLFTMYLMNQSYMNLIGDIMWEDNLGIQALKAVFGQPIDAIISTMSYPFDLTNFVTQTGQNLFFGPWNSGLPFQALTKSSFQIDWGTITIPFGWGNFLDYAPHTKMELFLPWGPGYVPIDPNDVSPYSNTPGNFNVSTFTDGSIQVKTNIELGKGTCVHNVIGNNGKVIGSYSGIVGKQVPMTALDTGGKIITTIGAVATMTAGAATAAGAMAGKFNTGQMTAHKQVDPLLNRPMFADAGYMQKASEGVSTVNRGANKAASALLSNPISFPRAGTFSDGSSAMTVQQPFLLVSRPVQSVPAQYGHYNGYPSNIHYANLSGLSGYTEISEIHLDNVTATADELAELDAVLKGGILL